VHKSIADSLTTEQIQQKVQILDNEVRTWQANEISFLDEAICKYKSGGGRIATAEEKDKLERDLQKAQRIYYARKKVVHSLLGG
jgi:hypothetical protein